MKQIKKAAVLGSGIMGSGIACHLANAGIEVLLLDILTPNLNETEQQSADARNRIAQQSLQKAIQSKPASLYTKQFANRISTGNFDDDLHKISTVDWIIEVIVEKLDIKQSLFAKVELHRTENTYITSNTSGIPIHLLTKDRSENFKHYFLGTHFFNPPRYLRLLEIIPTKDTIPEVVNYFMEFGNKKLGKQTVLCKDTPAFIANRIGVLSLAKIFELTSKSNLSLAAVDKLTGPAIGRPKTGTFRLADLVGIDTAAKVIHDLKQHCPNDAMLQTLEIPSCIPFLVENKWYGDKSGQGFFKKTNEKDARGKSILHALNLATLEYQLEPHQSLESLSLAKQIDDLGKRIRAMITCTDEGGILLRKSLGFLFAYAAERAPEIANDWYAIDHAMKAGFAWDLGPFELWDTIGFEIGMQLIQEVDLQIPEWVREMQMNGQTAFYKQADTAIQYYHSTSKTYSSIPNQDEHINLNNLRHKTPVFKNDEAVLHDIGDGVLCFEFRSKANTIGGDVLLGLQKAIDIAEQEGWKGLVIGNNATNFTVGANLMLVGMMAFQQDFAQLDYAVRTFQNTSMRCRYSSIPVVAATQGYCFGGGVELGMHCDAVIAAAESYVGLVEVAVGIIPGGAGTKEFAMRLSDEYQQGEVMIPNLIEKFKTIATAAVATSAYEAFDLGYFLDKKDAVEINLQKNIWTAKQRVLYLAQNYTQPIERNDIYVLGQTGLGALYAAANSLKLGGYASEHDINIAHKIAYVLCGGDLSSPSYVSERYLLDIEREAFLSLCGEAKTLERIQHMLEFNKPLRN